MARLAGAFAGAAAQVLPARSPLVADRRERVLAALVAETLAGVGASLVRIAAAAQAFTKVPANNELHIVNPPRSAPLGYPISTYTYVVVHKQSTHAAELRKLIFWALTQGQQPQFAAKLTFAKLSTVKTVLVAAEKTLKQVHS